MEACSKKLFRAAEDDGPRPDFRILGPIGRPHATVQPDDEQVEIGWRMRDCGDLPPGRLRRGPGSTFPSFGINSVGTQSVQDGPDDPGSDGDRGVSTDDGSGMPLKVASVATMRN